MPVVVETRLLSQLFHNFSWPHIMSVTHTRKCMIAANLANHPSHWVAPHKLEKKAGQAERSHLMLCTSSNDFMKSLNCLLNISQNHSVCRSYKRLAWFDVTIRCIRIGQCWKFEEEIEFVLNKNTASFHFIHLHLENAYARKHWFLGHRVC